MKTKKIRVLIVDDSHLFCKFLASSINSEPGFEVVGIAHNGLEGIAKARELKPDVVTMDVLMPEMDGVEAVGKLMAETPTPILMVSSLTKQGAAITFEAIEAGALDFIKKYAATDRQEMNQFLEEVIKKIRLIAGIKVVTHLKQFPEIKKRDTKMITSPKIVAIAVSTGGPSALPVVLQELPGDLPAAVIVVQHMAEGFTAEYARWLGERCSLAVVEAKNNDIVKSGVCYIAPGNYHLLLGNTGRIKINQEPMFQGYRPSANLTFESVAAVYRQNAVGLIMTGMGNDGARGIARIKELGGRTIAQDEATSVVFGMNRVAINEGSIQSVVPLDKIAEEIVRQLFS